MIKGPGGNNDFRKSDDRKKISTSFNFVFKGILLLSLEKREKFSLPCENLDEFY